MTLKHVQLFVLDEADRMLDMGFLPDVRRVIRHLPNARQTMLFSATMPAEIRTMADELLHDPEVVSVHPPSSTAEGVEQSLYFVDRRHKQHLLVKLLEERGKTRILVFTRTKHGANKLVRQLTKAGVDASAIHGNKSQSARTRALESFRKGKLRVLVATDVAARGIDVDAVSHVINYDLPNVPETYVHRIGRTGRAHRTGVALSFCDEQERPFLADIERLIGTHVRRVDDHPYPPSEPPPAATPLGARSKPQVHPRSASGRSGPRGGRRGRGKGTPRHSGRHSGRGRSAACG